MVLADDPADGLGFGAVVEIGTQLPDDLAGLLFDDEDDVGFTAVDDDVVGVEAFVTGVIPFVGAQVGHGIDVQPVAHAFGLGGTIVGVAAHGVLAGFAEAHLVEMVTGQPFPHDVAVPGGLHDQVVQQQLVGDFGIAHVAVGEHQSVAAVGAGLHAGSVIAHGVPFTLEVVMVTGHPAGLFARILNVFHLVECPGHIALPVHLDEVQTVLHGVFSGTAATAGQQGAAGEQLVGHAQHAFPDIDFTAVHVHEHSAYFLCLEDGETAPALFRIVDGDARGIDCRMAHNNSLYEKVLQPRSLSLCER